MQLIGIAGRKGAGKDSFAKPLIAAGFTQMRFADPLKGMLRALFYSAGCTIGEVEMMLEGVLKETPTPILCGKTPREAMQTLGTEWREMVGRTLWTNIAFERIKRAGPDAKIVVTDVRFHHEVMTIRALGGSVVRIERPTHHGEFSAHPSELEVGQLRVDATIWNTKSLEGLYDAARAYAGI